MIKIENINFYINFYTFYPKNYVLWVESYRIFKCFVSFPYKCYISKKESSKANAPRPPVLIFIEDLDIFFLKKRDLFILCIIINVS